jgi:hypothetical protein
MRRSWMKSKGGVDEGKVEQEDEKEDNGDEDASIIGFEHGQNRYRMTYPKRERGRVGGIVWVRYSFAYLYLLYLDLTFHSFY